MVYISVRPEKLKCSPVPVEGFQLHGVVKEHIYVGSIIKTVIEIANGQGLVMSSLTSAKLLSPGESVHVYWDRDDTVVMHTKEEEFYQFIKTLPKIEVAS